MGPVLALSAGHAVHDTYTGFLPPLLPEFIEKLSLTNTEAGLLTVFVQLPSLIQPFIGHLADRVSLRYFVILAPAVTALMMSLTGVASSYALLALFLIGVGFSSASLHAVGPVMTGNLSGRNLGRGMGFWMVGGELGRTLGPLVIAIAIEQLSLEGTPWLMVAGIAASIALYFTLKDVPGRAPNANQPLAWREAMQSMGPLLLPLAGLIVVRSFMVSALTTYLPIFMREQGSSRWLASVSLSVLEAAGMAGALLGGAFSDRLGRRWILFASLLTTPLLMFLFLATSGWLQFPLLLLLGLTALSVTPVIMALVQESFPDNRALANGVYMATSFILRSIVVVILGALGDLFGLRLAFAASAAIPLLGLPLILLLPRRKDPDPA